MKKSLLSFLFFCLIFQIYGSEEKSCNRAYCACQKKTAYSNNICPLQFKAELNYLFINFFEDGLEYAQIANEKIDDSNGDQKFNPGLRLLFSFPIKRSNLKENYVDLSYTYIKMKKASETTPRNLIYNTFLPPAFLNSSNASDSISGDFHTFDLDLTRPYFVSKYYISNPSLGIRGALIDQTYKIEYNIVNTINTVKAKNDYWGVGIKAGYAAEFIISKYYSIYAKTIFSLLFGKHDLLQNSTTPISGLIRYSVKEKRYDVQPNAQISLGLSFNKLFNKEKSKIAIRVGYEFHEWWDQNQLKRFMDLDPNSMKTAPRNNLKFNGLAFSLLLDI